MFWIYKCNSKNHPYQVYYGDWNDFFLTGRNEEWGSTEWVPALAQASPGDTILAYQTDRNELVGIARVVRLRPRGTHLDLILKPVKRIGVRVRPIKAQYPEVAAIPALKPGPIRTLYSIDHQDAQTLLRAAGLLIESERRDARAEGLVVATGGLFGSPLENRAIEAAAVKHVVRYFRNRGWTVRDHSNKKLGYDLSCTRGRSRLHVEVKGTTGSKNQFIITASERRHWLEDKSFVLALVMKARSTRPTLQLYYGAGSMRRFHFEPIAFMAFG